MSLIEKFRTWWEIRTGEDETPLDGDCPAWVLSLAVHVLLLVLIAVLSLPQEKSPSTLLLTASHREPETELVTPEEFVVADLAVAEPGAASDNGIDLALSLAPAPAEVAHVPSPQVFQTDLGRLNLQETLTVATGLNVHKNFAVRGEAGAAATGAAGAIDRLTHEILLSLEERPTLVVWLFDQSGSLARQRRIIHDRFDRVYAELGALQLRGQQLLTPSGDAPLLSAIIAFGQEVALATTEPTADVEQLKQTLRSIREDSSGIENVFQAVLLAHNRFHRLREPAARGRGPRRNVMIIVFTDEVGDDQALLEDCVVACRDRAIPVYVVGVPAPFGRQETWVKWVDPDSHYDQSPRWGIVNQGPESLLPECLKLRFSGEDEFAPPLDSGFGPFALTRLCYETGGIYFTVHPNRRAGHAIGPHEVAAFSAHLQHFFDPQLMRKYRPDYLTVEEYQRRLVANRARGALVAAARQSWLTPLENPPLRFVQRSQAELANALTEAQKNAARLEPKLRAMLELLQGGEDDRPQEWAPRWQAGYDLAMGRVLAALVRAEGYNAMLARAKQGLKFQHEKNNTWLLRASSGPHISSRLQQTDEKAQRYLQRVVEEHPGTPWALLASRELQQPLGWEWRETYVDLDPPRERAGNPNPVSRPDDQRQDLPPPKPQRPVPRL